MQNLTLGKIIVGGAVSAGVIWLLMQYSPRSAWLYVVLILLGLMMVYRNIVFAQISQISNLIMGLTK